MVSSPLTQSSNVSLRRRIAADHLIAEWRRVFGMDIAQDLHGITTVEHYRCEDSGLEFFLPASLAGSPRLYARLQQFDWYYESHTWELDLALADLRGLRRVVEIGSGSGAFLSRCREMGVDALGLETNPEACRLAADRGLPTECLTMGAYVQQRRARVDAVCAFQVLEHLADPRRFLEDCSEVLVPGGVLLLSVPNADGYMRYLDDPLDRPPHHMTRWPPRAFRSLSKAVPFMLEQLVVQSLESAQVPHFVRAQTARVRARGLGGRLLVNRATLPLLKLVLLGGLRRFLTGHSLYARLRRTS